MTPNNPKLSALWILEPETVVDNYITPALRKYDGSLQAAARYLRIGKATIYRWASARPEILRLARQITYEAREQRKRRP